MLAESHSEADNQVTTADNQKAPSPGSESPSMTSGQQLVYMS